MRPLRLALTTVLLLPTPLLGQSEPRPLREQSWAAQIAVLDGESGDVGVAKLISNRTQLGLNVGFSSFSRDRERSDGAEERELDTTEFTVRAELRRYVAPDEKVAPFLTLSVAPGLFDADEEFTFPDGDQTTVRTEAFFVTTRVGGGAEWFPTGSVGISGFAGLKVEYLDRDSGGVSDTTEWEIDTFTTSVTLRYYW